MLVLVLVLVVVVVQVAEEVVGQLVQLVVGQGKRDKWRAFEKISLALAASESRELAKLVVVGSWTRAEPLKAPLVRPLLVTPFHAHS